MSHVPGSVTTDSFCEEKAVRKSVIGITLWFLGAFNAIESSCALALGGYIHI